MNPKFKEGDRIKAYGDKGKVWKVRKRRDGIYYDISFDGLRNLTLVKEEDMVKI